MLSKNKFEYLRGLWKKDYYIINIVTDKNSNWLFLIEPLKVDTYQGNYIKEDTFSTKSFNYVNLVLVQKTLRNWAFSQTTTFLIFLQILHFFITNYLKLLNIIQIYFTAWIIFVIRFSQFCLGEFYSIFDLFQNEYSFEHWFVSTV